MRDISGFGLRVQLEASFTFPAGYTLTEFADDGDSLDIPAIAIADKAMGLNGDLLVWSKGTPIGVTINIIPSGDDDKALAILLEANRVGRGKTSARDIITLNVMYPDGSFVIFDNGKILEGMPGIAIASAGRMKTKPYQFAFENRAGTSS